ncbi:bifunctional indole-3-glycerol-phosphate synthase TrpC/phosphoribosylanthranilate isomerase TrpF [Sphingomonas lutea]|uniref:N-(5'-phosphoribosyl)anthranilate isomerase n=1 Tax=Sphingomonas lutea TaxID=1045317 RepID=A0A7G9SJT5_9SPHN|nr:bifunctional indole-3-glycerol-phosphate synthase TrpC/phosphoribosylanthranilate isomerase TrpF [Sphingomonas lutea]QNN68110.1 bifunctional indole-3-glycerol-phosphate synthase TrpC/phosphoribosylanthranilate isomerase TrpF [Sphingomonas lutea]
MADVLDRILARKRTEVAARRRTIAPPPPSVRSLKTALARPDARFIMEVKPRSPSGHVARYSVEEASAAYAPVADAISVLTDSGDFGGSLDDIGRVREQFDGPILAKDFVIDAFQVPEARAAGADAVLAMLSVLDDSLASEVMAAARRLAMDVLVEVHDETEMARAIALGADIIGINNRDLKTLQTDLRVTERLAPLAPEGVLVVAESGIASRADVMRLSPLVDAFLVGSSLMAADDIGGAARSLIHGRVKICGLTREEDVEAVIRAGATHAGLILVPDTPRALSLDAARPLAMLARRGGLKTVGVFRDEESAQVIAAARALQLDAIQLHGRESAREIAQFRSCLPPSVEIWAVRGIDENMIEPPRNADRSLFDTRVGDRCGGSGIAFDWDRLRTDPELPGAFISGGLNAANIGGAAKLGAHGLDLSSGVESAPGIKDQAKLAGLFDALRPPARRAA